MMNGLYKTCTLVVLAFSVLGNTAAASRLQQDEKIIFFPTNAYWDQGWVLPVKGWVFEYEQDSFWRRGSMAFLQRTLEVDRRARKNPHFKDRAWMFLVDNERDKQIKVDVGGRVFTMNDSKPNGHFKGEMKLRTRKAERLAGKEGWVRYEAVLPGRDKRKFKGEVQLLDAEGISIISDIDDTIKVSRVAHKKKLIKNTFLKKYRAVPGMARLYRLWARDGASFHYVSGSPWQLYPALDKFMRNAGFPKGSFDLRRFRAKDSSFIKFFKQPRKPKIRAIGKLLDNFPYRKFILVGDSTESDPEIYAQFARSHPNQVHHIVIRNVKDRPMDRHRIKKVLSGLDRSQWTVFNAADELMPTAVP